MRSAMLRVSAFIVLTLCSGCGKRTGTTDKPDEPKDVADAAKLVDLEQCEAAVEKLKTYVSGHPSEVEAFLVLGDAWTCHAFDASTSAKSELDRHGAFVDESNAALVQARTSYSSAVKLAPTDVRALTSLAAVEVFTGSRQSALEHLGAVRTAEPANRAALNLLAFLVSLEDRKAVLPLFEKSCNPNAPTFKEAASIPPLCALRDEGGSACGEALLLAQEVLDGRTYPQGTIVQPVDQDGAEIEFEDHLFPATKAGTGWRLRRVDSKAYPSEARPPLAQRVPDLAPASSWRPEDAAARTAYDAWHIPVNKPEDLESRLGVIPDVIAGTVRSTGPDVRVEGRFSFNYADNFNLSYSYEFTPVAFEHHVYESRRIAASKVARMDIPRDAALVIAADACLTPEEKRGLLARLVVPRIPLVYGVWAYNLDFRSLRLAIRNGEVTLMPPFVGKTKGKFVNGDLVVDLPQASAGSGGH